MSYFISEDSTLEDFDTLEDALSNTVNYVEGYNDPFEREECGHEKPSLEWIARARQFIIVGKDYLDTLSKELDKIN